MSSISTAVLFRVLDAVPAAVIVADSGGVVRYANRTARQALGVAEPVGTPVHGYLFSPDGKTVWDTIREQLARSASVRARVNLAAVGGSETECELQGMTLGDFDGDTLCALVFLDITETLRYERHIEDKNIQMARMNAELLRSNADLHRISELKSKFLSIASHELKTPLTLIKGYADIIADTMRQRLAPDVYEMVCVIRRAAERLDGVLNSILDAMRLERGRLRLNAEHMDLAAVVRQCACEFGMAAQRRGIAFQCQIADGLPPFCGDRSRMEQVLANLMSNAIKYSPDNSTVTVRLWLEDSQHFHLAVEDQGIGISPQEQIRLFQPFYEVVRATSHSTDPLKFQGGGIGLGLFIAKGIVEQHGGTIWVESEGGREGCRPGSRFHVRVPLQGPVQAEGTAKAGNDAGENARRSPPPTVSGGLVLVADSDAEAVEAVRMALEGTFGVVWVDNGGAAVARALEHRPDVALMERNLPVLDGFNLCRVLRAQEETTGTALAFFSVWSDEETVRRCFACGADDYIIKPVDAAELRERVSRLIARKRARDIAPGIGSNRPG